MEKQHVREGQDVAGTLKIVHKLGLGLGFTAGATDAIMYANSKTLSETLQRVAFRMVPIYGTFMVYGSVTFLVARYRGKANGVEHVAGVIATAPILNNWLKLPFSYTVGILQGMAFIVALCKCTTMDYEGMLDLNPVPIKCPQYHNWK